MSENVIYVGNLPRQLGESQIKRYFDQFGRVVAVRLMRSKKTNNSRGYAFVKFETSEIAKIAAEAMDRYFIDGRTLRVHIKPVTVKSLFKRPRAPTSKSAKILSLASTPGHLYTKIEALLSQDEHVDVDQVKKIVSVLEKRLTKLLARQDSSELYKEQINTIKGHLEAITSKFNVS